MAKVSKNIKKYRKEKNITQDMLAEQLNVTRQAISNWENDKSQPDIESLKSMADFMHVEIYNGNIVVTAIFVENTPIEQWLETHNAYFL